MLVKFLGGWVNPDRVEAVMPAGRGGYLLATRGGNMISVSVSRKEMEKELASVGLLKKLKGDAEQCEER